MRRFRWETIRSIPGRNIRPPIPQFRGKWLGEFRRSVSGHKGTYRLNPKTAISVYQAMGGTLDESDEPQQVLEKLKSVVTDELASRLPGLSGAVIDARVRAVTSTKTPDRVFAEWNPAKKKFEVVTDGDPTQSLKILRFELGEASETVAKETRNPSMKYAATSSWIWNERNTAISRWNSSSMRIPS